MKSKSILYMAIAVFTSMSVTSLMVNATEPNKDFVVSIEQVVERVREYQQSQGIWQTQKNIADANIKNSKLWANPTLTVERAGFSNDQDRELSIGVSQPLLVLYQWQ